MQSRRLLIGVNQPIFCACNDDHRPFQLAILGVFPECVRDHQSRFGRAGSYLRRPERHFFRKAGGLTRNISRPKNLSQHRLPHGSSDERCEGIPEEISSDRNRRPGQGQYVKADTRIVIPRCEHQAADEFRVVQCDGNRDRSTPRTGVILSCLPSAGCR